MSVTGDFGSASPGLDLSANQNGSMIGAVVTLMVIATLSVSLRAFLRIISTEVDLALDDYLIFIALLCCYGLGTCVLISLSYGNGHHIETLTDHDFTVLWKLLFAHVILYAAGVTCTKTSIMMFYRRIFKLYWSLWPVMFLILGYFTVIIVTIAVACRPLPYFWEQYTHPDTAKGTCIDTATFFLGNGIAAVLIDVIILCVPIPITWKLQMPKSQRMAVIGILLLGSFVCIAGAYRVYVLNRNTHSDDPSWTIAPVFVWSCVEPCIGVVCACLPTFTPMFRRWWAKLITKKSTSSGAKGEYSSGYLGRSQRSQNMNDRVLESHGDEVELTNEFRQQQEESIRTAITEDDGGDHDARIRVKDEVTITWSQP